MTDIGSGAPLAPQWDNPAYFDDVTEDVIEEQAKQQGMAESAGASAAWQKVARDWFASLPVGMSITADDLTDAIGVPTSQGAVGAAFAAAASRGLIAPVGMAKSRREGRHNSRTLAWEKAVPPTVTEPVGRTVWAECTGCHKASPLDTLSSKYGKPQLVGEVKGKRLWEAKCHVCKPSKASRLEAIWKER